MFINFGKLMHGLECWGLESDHNHYMRWFGEEIKVDAYDENKNIFHKVAARGFSDWKYGFTISFGWPCEYYFCELLRHYPYKKPMCIDAAGRNHRDSPVYISAAEMNRVIKHFLG